MECPGCSRDNTAGSRYCVSCGARLAPAHTVVEGNGLSEDAFLELGKGGDDPAVTVDDGRDAGVDSAGQGDAVFDSAEDADG